MALNLVRNSRVFMAVNTSTNLNSDGTVKVTGLVSADLYELQVLDGFSFSQSTNAETVSISEAGNTPNRGARNFNTSQAPVDFSFTTYVRPKLSGANVVAEERYLWNALLGSAPIATAVTMGTGPTLSRAATTASTVTYTGTAVPTSILTAGVVFTMGGVAGNFANQWNTPIRVTSVAGTTQLIGEYLTAPSVAAGTAPGAIGSPTYQLGSWAGHTAVAADVSFSTAAYTLATAAKSNVNQLQPFALIVAIDSATYLIDNAALNQAQVDFSLDGIASIQWSGNGTAIRTVAQTNFADGATNTTTVLSGGVAGTAVLKQTDARYITNKLSTVQLVSTIGGASTVSGQTPTTYTLALTGGSLVINNNIQYVTPANLGVVNIPIGYFTGGLVINGSVQAYLHSGSTPTNNTGQLLTDILAGSSSSSETKFRMQVEVGGLSNAVRMEMEMDGAFLSVPSIETGQIMSTTINFNAQGSNAMQAASTNATGGNSYDITALNPIYVRYFSN